MTTGLAKWVFALVAIFSAARLWAEDPSQAGLEIARSADKANKGFGAEYASVRMDLINAHGDVTQRKITIETLEGTDDGDKSKVTFESPPDVKGTKLLTWNHLNKADDQWLYLPAIKRVKRISSTGRNSSFMGSEFTYEDLSSIEVAKFTYRLLDKPLVGDRPTYLLERLPKGDESGYSRQVVWLDKEYQTPLRIEYFDRNRELSKVAVFGSYSKFGRYWRASTITMENLRTKKENRSNFREARTPGKSFREGF